MNVLFDHQSFTGLPYGGVSRYFFELMRSFAKRSDIEFELSLWLSNNEYLDQASFSNHWRYPAFAHLMNAHRVASVLNRQYSRQRIKAGKFDIFHPTYYHRYFLDTIGKKPFVLTFFDATSERYGKQYPELGEGLYETKKQLLSRADCVICISEFSKQDLLHFFPVSPDKVQVVPLGTTISEYVLTPEQQKPPMDKPYLLYVGKRGLYKNFNGFFRAIQPVLHRHPDLQVVCCGGGAFTPDEQSLFREARLGERVHFHPLTDAGLINLYQHALAFVFPSLNEGFGIPVLEAYSAGCPVVLSDRSSLPEVGADAALYFDPENDESIADAIDRVVTDDALRTELRQKGRERLRHFSCDKTAQQTLDVYQSLG